MTRTTPLTEAELADIRELAHALAHHPDANIHDLRNFVEKESIALLDEVERQNAIINELGLALRDIAHHDGLHADEQQAYAKAALRKVKMMDSATEAADDDV